MTPSGLCFALSLWFACPVGRIDVSLLPLGILAIRIHKTFLDVLGFAVQLTSYKCLCHTTGSTLSLHDVQKLSCIFTLSLAWHEFLWYNSSNFGNQQGLQASKEAVQVTMLLKILYAHVPENVQSANWLILFFLSWKKCPVLSSNMCWNMAPIIPLSECLFILLCPPCQLFISSKAVVCAALGLAIGAKVDTWKMWKYILRHTFLYFTRMMKLMK